MNNTVVSYADAVRRAKLAADNADNALQTFLIDLGDGATFPHEDATVDMYTALATAWATIAIAVKP